MDETDPDASETEASDELYAALGRLVFAFGQLEEALQDALWMALGQRDEIRILTSGLRFPELVSRFRALYSGFEHESTSERGVDDLCTRLVSLNQERNREIHSVWGFWANTGRPVRMRRNLQRGALSFRMESVDPKDLLTLAASMNNAVDKIWEIALDNERQSKTRAPERMRP